MKAEAEFIKYFLSNPFLVLLGLRNSGNPKEYPKFLLTNVHSKPRNVLNIPAIYCLRKSYNWKLRAIILVLIPKSR